MREARARANASAPTSTEECQQVSVRTNAVRGVVLDSGIHVGSSKLEGSSEVEPRSHNPLVAGSIHAPPTKLGRPRKGEPRPEPNQPWVGTGLSRATYYRRQAEQRAKQ